MRRITCLFFFLAVFVIVPLAAAEMTKLTLPTVMADFAWNPITRTIAAIDSKNRRIHLLRLEGNIRQQSVTLIAEAAIQDSSSSVIYKRFGKESWFAVVGTLEPSIQLFDAQTLESAQKIPISGTGASNVASSLNPADPFLYYSHGAGREFETGAVDVRKMVDRGRVFSESVDCVLSYDGNLAYTRKDRYSPRIVCLTMTSSFGDPAPAYQRSSIVNGSGGYACDPVGQFAFAGTSVFTRDFTRMVARLPATPLCFFRNRPVIIGQVFERTSRIRPESILLKAISYNSFAAGPMVTVESPGNFDSEIRPIRSRPDDERVIPKLRVIADDTHGQVIVACRNKLHLVPLEAFDVQDEPFMVAEVASKRVTVGIEQMVSISSPDKRVSINLNSLPDGAVRSETGITWTPPAETVGPVVVPITMKFNETQRTVPVEFQVEQPYSELPFAVTGLQLTESGDRILCWNSPDPPPDSKSASYSIPQISILEVDPPATDLAVVDPTGLEQPVLRQLSYVAGLVATFGDYVVTVPRNSPSRVDVFHIEDLTKAHVIIADSAVQRILTSDDSVIVEEVSGVEIFNRVGFNRHAFIESRHRENSPLVREAGILQNGRLRSIENKTLLVVSPDIFPTLPGADGRLYAARHLAKAQAIAAINSPPLPSSKLRNAVGKRETAPLRLHGGAVTVVLEEQIIRTNPRQPNDGSFSHLQTRELSLSIRDSAGVRSNRIMVDRRNITPWTSVAPLLTAGSTDTVFVAMNQRLIRLTVDRVIEDTTIVQVPDPRFEQRQSLVLLNKEGQSVLEHRLTGGEKPVTVRMANELKGASFNPKSLQLILDNASILEEARSALIARFQSLPSANDVPQAVSRFQESLASRAAQLGGRPLNGIPVAVPVHLTAFDNTARTTELQYFVFAEVDSASVIADIADAIRKRTTQRAAQARKTIKAPGSISTRSTQSVPDSTNEEISRLNQRIDGLQLQLDRVSKQLNQVLKILNTETDNKGQPGAGTKVRQTNGTN